MVGRCVRRYILVGWAGWAFSYGLARMGGGIFLVVRGEWRYILCEYMLFMGE